MENVKWEVKDNKLIIEVDLSLESGLSKSGKTITIASTKGNQKIEGTNAVIGLNVYGIQVLRIGTPRLITPQFQFHPTEK